MTPPNDEKVRWRSRWIETSFVVAAMAFVIWFYLWTVAVNGGFQDWGHSDYYRLLVRGWAKGQLALDKAPSPELLALSDPYDPAQNSAHRLPDASYYKGKYYLYFGAAPAFTLMLPFHLLTGREMTGGAAVFIFCTVAFLAASTFWLAVRRRYFPDSARVMAPIGVLALGFGTHLLVLAQRPAFWELPIAAGIAFTLLALHAVFRAIHGSRPLIAMAFAGVCLGLAVGSRPTWVFAGPLLLAPLWLAWRERKSKPVLRPWWQLGLAAAVPLGICALAIMAHNHARFGNVLEFGQHYQLSGAYEGKLVHFSPRFIAHNMSVYFFQPLKWTWQFPFVAAQTIPVDLPGYFGTEEVSGLAVTFVFVWFVAGVPLLWHGRTELERRTLTAAIAGMLGCLAPVAALLLSYFSTTTRYQADFAVAFGILALCGMIGIERAAQGNRTCRALVLVLATAACVITVIMGFLTSLDYHGRGLSRSDPALWSRLQDGAEGALGEAGLMLGQFDGPSVLKVRMRQQSIGTIETFWQPADSRADERIVVEHIGEQLIRFGYIRGQAPLQWGRPLKWEPDHTHTVEVQLPSLYGPPRGWMRGLRESLEYRERTSVAVWFSGGRALVVAVEPMPADLKPGGTTGAGFSGVVRSIRMRLYREADGPDQPLTPANGTRGELLRLRVVLPRPLSPAGEPLFSAGVHYGSDMLFVRPVAGGFKIVFEHFGAQQIESAVLPHTSGTHDIELVLASFGDAKKDFGFATGEVIVRLDGVEILRGRYPCYTFPEGNEKIGRNPFGTTCGPRFRGWIVSAEWVGKK
jgi:hypothetical protein